MVSYRFVMLALAGTALFQPMGYANPLGGSVAAGTADIVATSANQVDINQTSAKAVINWASFNIAAGETTNFNQPNSSAVTLNRIGDANPSQIMGKLKANGSLMLVNPNGVMIGSTGSINAASLVVTTADITDGDFMAGKYVFSKAGNPNAQINVNGSVNTSGGYTAIFGPKVSIDSAGNISAKAGKVALGGGDVFTLDPVGDHLINFALPKGVTRSGAAGSNAAVTVAGSVYADAGTVEVTAKSASTLLDSAVNVSGIVQAHSLAAENGRITLKADNVVISGQLSAMGEFEYGPGGPSGPGGTAHDGGKIVADANKNLTFTGTARADTNSLAADGGSIYMAGRTLNLGGSARTSVNNPGIYLADAGVTTFYAKGTLNINAPEALTIADSLVDGGTTYLLADKNIVVNSAINGPASYVPGKLMLSDGNGGGDLNVNLHQKINLLSGVIATGPNTSEPRQALDGQAVRLTVHENASLQNGVDVAAPGAVVSAYYGSYGNVAVDTPNLTLKGPNAGIAGDQKRRLEASLNTINLLSEAKGTVVDGFEIGQDSYNFHIASVYVNADDAQILNNRIRGGSMFGAVFIDGADDVSLLNNQFGIVGEPYGVPDYMYVDANPAISVNDSDRVTIKGNDVVSTYTMGIVLGYSDDAEISENNFNTIRGMDIYQSSNANIHNNDFVNHLSASYPGSGIAFFLSNSADDEMANNTFSNYDYGAIISNATRLKITGGSLAGVGAANPGFDITSSQDVLLQVPVSGYTPKVKLSGGSTLAAMSYSY